MAVEDCKYGAGIQNSMDANGGVLDQYLDLLFIYSMELLNSVDYAIFYFAKILFFYQVCQFL